MPVLGLCPMPEDNKCIVYWARLASHTDPQQDGYIGYSINTLIERQTSHYKKAKSNKLRNVHFHNALAKYGDKVVWSIIAENLTKIEALILEEKLRPKITSGWNTDKGGIEAVSSDWYADTSNKMFHQQRTSEATKQKIAENDTPEARSERAKEVWSNPEYKKLRAGEISGEKNPAFGLFGTDHPAAGHKKTEAGLKAISEAHKGKKLTEAQKKAISDARSEAIGVFDKDRETMYIRRMAGESVASISLSYPITQKSVDRNIRKWWKENELPRPCKLTVNPPVREQKSEKIAINKPTNVEHRRKHKVLKASVPKASEKKKLSKKLEINKSKIAEQRTLHQTTKAQSKILKHLENDLNIAKHRIFGEIRSSKKETKLLFKKIKLQLNKKNQINKNRLKFHERALKDTKHIIDRETGKFQGQNARASKFTDTERATICKRRINGETYAKIGESYGKGVSTIKNICQNWGPKNNYPYEIKIGTSDLKKVNSPEVKTAICKEYSEGVSAMNLAKKYDVSFQMVYTYLADWGPKNDIPYVKQSYD